MEVIVSLNLLNEEKSLPAGSLFQTLIFGRNMRNGFCYVRCIYCLEQLTLIDQFIA